MNRRIPCSLLCLAALLNVAGCIADSPLARDPQREITAEDLATPGEPAPASAVTPPADASEEGGAICTTEDGAPYEATSC
jgi:hypothetical protein